MPEDKLRKYEPDVLLTFTEWVEKNIPKMDEYYHKVDKETWCRILLEDSRHLSLDRESVDLIVKLTICYLESRLLSLYHLVGLRLNGPMRKVLA